jgi:hypothetical protein
VIREPEIVPARLCVAQQVKRLHVIGIMPSAPTFGHGRLTGLLMLVR